MKKTYATPAEEIAALRSRIQRQNSEIGRLRYRAKKAERIIQRVKYLQQRRIDMGRDAGLDALQILELLTDYKS